MTSEAARIARLGAALSSESRAALLYALLGGTAHTNAELARHLGLAPSTVSEHVGVLLDARLVEVAAQGRHRYVRLAGESTAALLEHVGVVAGATGDGPDAPRLPAALAYARACYGHLAGRLGVALHDALHACGAVERSPDGHLTLTPAGRTRLTAAGIDLGARTDRPLVRPCLDWTQRRDHVAGVAADRILAHALADGWVHRHATLPRALVLTELGRHRLATTFEMELP